MQLLRKIPRTLLNVFIVRGKWRIPRILIFVCLIGLTYTVGREALCMLSPSMCYNQLTVVVQQEKKIEKPRESVEIGQLNSDHEGDQYADDFALPNSLVQAAAMLEPPNPHGNSKPQQKAREESEASNKEQQNRNKKPNESENVEEGKQDGNDKAQLDSPKDPVEFGNVNEDAEGPTGQAEKRNSTGTPVNSTESSLNTTTVDTTEPVYYEEEEDDLGEEGETMSPEAVAEALRTGAMCKTVCPPFRWSMWSPCSKACGRGRKYRKAIYEIVCPSSNFCPRNRVEESVCDIPCKFDPDKYGGPDGLDLYPVNPLNPIIYLDKHGCGNWLVEYEKVHNEILSGKRPPQFLVYSTGKGEYPTAGGISGRVKGITTVFFMAVLLERAFLIEWDDPPGLSEYLEPKSFDWANLGAIKGRRHGPPRDIASWKAAKDDGHSSQWYMNTNFSRYFKYPVERIQGARYDFTYALLRNPELMPKAFEYGIDQIKCRICCAWDMLFKMTSKFEEAMKSILMSVGHPAKPILAVQVRAKSDNIDEAVKVAEHNVNCGQKAASDLKLNPVYIPVFNNRLVVHIVAKKFKRLIKTPIEIETATRTVHTHLGNLPADTELAVAKGVQERTFKEFFVMLNSTVLIRTKGYLGSMANIADAIRRHYAMHNKKSRVYTYTAGGTSCSPMEEGTKIE